MFFYRPVNGDKPNFVAFLIFVDASASLTLKISSFETGSHFESRPKTKDIPRYGSHSERAKIAIH